MCLMSVFSTLALQVPEEYCPLRLDYAGRQGVVLLVPGIREALCDQTR